MANPPVQAEAPKALRIESIALCDFRAFPGPHATTIELKQGAKTACNLLLYGENGAGKSSLFEAFRGLFARRPSRKFFERERNVFSTLPEADAHVLVTFNDGKEPARWTMANHPGRGAGDPRVVATALRAAMLDYRALLDTNYAQGNKAPNLFDIAMTLLLADYPLVGGQTLGELWASVDSAKPSIGWESGAVDAACITFNTEYAAAVDALLPFAQTLLKDLLSESMSLDGLSYGTVRYVNAHQRRDRIFDGCLLRPSITYRTHGVKRPQSFLNEAKQSALALAIYLAARLACTQTAKPSDARLLVLDDLLIGLDQSNRLPVLNLLMKHFSEWQIVLLTHDRTWFEMARAHLQPASDWAYLELHDASSGVGSSMPEVRHLSPTAPDQALDQAELFLDQGHIAGAATYARTAFELGLRQWAERRSVKLRFRADPGDLSSQELIDAIRTQQATDPATDAAKALKAVEMFRTVVLNPLSHATPPAIVKSEVQGAVAAVRFMLSVSRKR
jgi:energy-coupling factor transporter ATP-binding protein EcfA2